MEIGALGQIRAGSLAGSELHIPSERKALEFLAGTAEAYALAKEPHGEEEAPT